MKELSLVMPVYNEEAAIENVIEKWDSKLKELNIDFDICVYNDGSKDNTAKILENLKSKISSLVVVNKENSGHGPTILNGYRECSKKYKYIFQTDSDDEMGVDGFYDLWKNRNDYDFLIGIRNNRVQELPRKIISLVSRICIKIFYGLKGPYDVNSPYRLMKSDVFSKLFETIPSNTFAPNVIISGYVANKKLKFYEIPVDCKPRATGEVSIKKFKLLKAAAASFIQTICFSVNLKGICK